MLWSSPMIIVFLISIVLSFVLSLIYKVFTNQEKAKEMKEKMDELKKKINEAQKNKNQKDMTKYQNEMLQMSSEQMRMNMKPMIITFAVVIPVFIWLFPALYGSINIEMDDSLHGTLKYGNMEKSLSIIQENPLVISIDNEEKTKGDVIALGEREFTIQGYDKGKKMLTLKQIVVNLPFSMPFYGNKLGWLGWYILVSIPMTTVFRKALGVVQ